MLLSVIDQSLCCLCVFDYLYAILFSAKDQDDTMLEEEVAKVSCQSLYIFSDFML